MSFKTLIICFVYVFCASSSANDEPETSQSWIKKNFIILDSKLDSLNEEMEQWKTNRSTGNDAICADNNNNTIIVNTLQQLQTTMDKMDEKLENVTKFPPFCKKIDNFEDNHFKKFEDKLEKLEGKLETIENILWQLVNKSQSPEVEVKDDLESQSDRVESYLIQQKALNVCEDNPCTHGARCVPISRGKDFRCAKCPGYKNGKYCEKLNCELNKKCWKHNNTLYKLLEPNVNWTEANRKCEAENMTLMMPKEKPETEFLVEQLGSIYGWLQKVWFWMGIVKSGNGSGWKWIDGSELGSYVGGRSDFKNVSGDYYGLLYLFGGDAMWTYTDGKYPCYPLCEKRDFAL